MNSEVVKNDDLLKKIQYKIIISFCLATFLVVYIALISRLYVYYNRGTKNYYALAIYNPDI